MWLAALGLQDGQDCGLLRMTDTGTKLTFRSDVLNGGSCQEQTFSSRLTGIAE